MLAVGGGGPADDGGDEYSVLVPALYLHSLSSKYRLKCAGSYCNEARDLKIKIKLKNRNFTKQ